MRVVLPALLLTMVGCGADAHMTISHQDVFENPSKTIAEGADYYGGSWSDRADNFREDNDDGYIMAKNHAGKKANEARKYAYERGVKEARHGDPSVAGPRGEVGQVGTEGADGPQGSTGPKGLAGQPGAAGTDGKNGEAGAQGPAGDDFDGAERLAELEDQVATLELVVAANQTLTDARLAALEAQDVTLANSISDLQDDLDVVSGDLQRLKRQTRRAIRRMMYYVLFAVANSGDEYYYDIDVEYNDIDVDVDYTEVEIDNRTITTIRDNILQILFCDQNGAFAECSQGLDD